VGQVEVMKDLELTDAEQALREYARKIGSMRVEDIDLLSIEGEVRALVEARAREVMAVALKRADTDAPEVEIDGQRWGNRRVDRGEYWSMFGTMAIERSTYQRAGGGRVAVPLDLRLGMVEGRYTPKMARVLTHVIAVTTEEEGAALLACCVASPAACAEGSGCTFRGTQVMERRLRPSPGRARGDVVGEHAREA